MLEGFTTFMDCCLRTRASNVVGNEVDYLGGIKNEWQQTRMYFVELHSSQCGYRVGF